MKRKFTVKGMTCSACQRTIENDLQKLPGVEQVAVSLLTNQMVVDFDDSVLNVSQITDRVKKSGYQAKAMSDSKQMIQEVTSSDPLAEHQFRLIVSIVFLSFLLIVSMGEMVGLWLPAIFTQTEYSGIFALTQLLLVLPILIFNRAFFVNGFRNLWKRKPNMDSLIAIGAGAAFIYGIFALYQIAYGLGAADHHLVEMGRMNLYFEAAGAILTFVTLGKYLEEKSKSRTTSALKRLLDLSPKVALVLQDEKWVEVPTELLNVGDIIFIKPGMTIPVDGKIIEGQSDIDESLVTGESLPVYKTIGDKVISATINRTGSFQFKAEKVGADTTIAQIIQLVEAATQKKIPIQKLADKISGIFVPLVISISLIAFIVWLAIGSTFAFAFSVGIAVLVISCPCALGLATPVAIMVGTGRGADAGILLKNPESLEIAHKLTTIVIDKTGTITKGKPEVTDVLNLRNDSSADILEIAASLEQYSEHPLAKAIVDNATNNKIILKKADNFVNVAGQGVMAIMDKIQYFAGNQKLMESNHIPLESALITRDELALEGKTAIFIATSTKVLGIIALRDTVKETSKAAIGKFHSKQLEVIMLTGDHRLGAQAIQKEVGIDKVFAEVMPEEKASIIENLQKEGKIVAMIGDGINDAIALTMADVGIAIGAGSDIAIDSADVVLMRSDLLDAVTAISLSKKTMSTIKLNLFWAFIYNIIGIPLAAGALYPLLGWQLSPIIASAAMSLSSVSVVLNALRLKWIHIT